ncbi:F-box domain-containing protein [Blastomyces dermatitidis ATCC 18188]|uniref:F-box domain-containing protein n=1 Tax=Ajellomyces dermatitidis (strain ATCC 18188 / CBS 674.68) TaxID=653446 RepID=F2TPN5_AJEDA|nr:F-box domain-containing protein [Blastomyces dermatitidis ATCC 18188]EQL31343.1 hypothetical protein BDFG_06289 [Blastomyces dermatitidis ATCC 26199]
MLTAAKPSTHHRATLLSLPNELIQLILDLFPIRSLLPLTLVCHRIHDIITRLIHYRLNALVSAIEPDNIFLECYHPVCKPVGRYLKCAHLHTDVLTNGACPHSNDTTQKDWHLHRSQIDSSKFSSVGYLGRLKESYTHFHPLCHTGPWINTNMHTAPPPRYIPVGSLSSEQTHSTLIRGSIFLDENELFSQLITGIWLGRQNRQICLLDGGVLRLWRQWLGDMDRRGKFAGKMASTSPAKGYGGGGGKSYYTLEVGSENRGGESPVYPLEDHSVVWLGEKRAGLKFRACQQRRTENLSFTDDSGSDEADEGDNDDGNNPVCYDVEIEELLVRTTTLLLAADKGFWVQ